MGEVKFGTDGWRAVISEDFTFANLDRVSQATADYWSSFSEKNPGLKKLVVVGYDRRFLSDQFGRRVSEVLVGNGFEVVLNDSPSPTPAISLAVKQMNAIGGVMITASHNPAAFNGFKLKAYFGGSAEPAMCQEIEGNLDKSPVRSIDFATGIEKKLIRVVSLRGSHLKALKKLADFKLISKSRLRFAHEALFGVGAGCFDEILAGTSCTVTTLNKEHDPNFGGINPEPVARNYTKTSAYLKKHPHDICLVTDGDADRVGGMDGKGNPLTTHQLICLLLHHYIVNRKASGRVVKALTTTSMVDRMCQHYGLELTETGVGFKYICAEVLKGGGMLGFEESGGIAFPGHVPERDGILSGLMLLEMLATEKTSINKLLSRLQKQFGSFCYDRIDTHFPLEKRSALMEYCRSNPPSRMLGSPLKEIKSFDGVKFIAEDESWLMLRGSGTEPILRIYAEAKTPAKVKSLLKMGIVFTRKV